MKQIKTKLDEQRGETLVEILCAVLLTSLAAALLASVPGAAVRLNKRALAQDEMLYQALSDAEKCRNLLSETEERTVDITITLESENGSSSAVFEGARIYGKEGVVTSYRWEEGK